MNGFIWQMAIGPIKGRSALIPIYHRL